MKKLIVILLTFLSINSFSQTYMQKIISSSKLNDTIVGAYLANPATNGMVGFGLRSEDDTVYYYVQGDSLVLEFDDGTVYIIYDKTDTTVIYSGQVLEFDVDMAKFDTIQADNYIGISSVTIGSENQMPTSNAAGTDFDYTGVGTIDSIDTDRIEVDTIEVSEDILFTTDATVNIGSNVSAAGTGFFKRLVLDQNQTFETGTGVWFGNGNTGFYEAANNDFRFKVGNAIVALWSSAEVQLKWVLPVVDNSYCLGTTTRNWRNLYLQGSIYNANDECIDIDSAASTFHHDIHFSDDATYDVGSSTNEVDSIYVVSVKASGNIESDTITANTGIFNTDVGIGVTDPIESLDINGGIISRGALVLGGVPGTYISYESGVSSLFAYGSDGSTKGSFAFLTRESDGGNSSTPLVIDGNDRIGINQSSPSEKLDLVGNFEITGDTYMGLNNTYDIGNDTASVDSVYVNIIEANTVNANIITATGGTSTNWNTGYSNSTGVVTVHSDVTNAGSGIITTGTERTNWNAGYNDKIKSLGFATGTGVLTLTQQDDGTLTQDLDGRYLELGGGTMTGNIAQSADISLGTANYDITLDSDTLKNTSDLVFGSSGTDLKVDFDTTTFSGVVEFDGGGGGNLNLNTTSQSIWSNTTNTAAVIEDGATGNIILGENAGNTITTADGNIFIGDSAGQKCNGNYNIMIGPNAGRNQNINSISGGNIFIGSSSGGGGSAVTLSEEGNVCVGIGAGGLLEGNAGQNILIGQVAGATIEDADRNVIIGYGAGNGGGATDEENVYIGASAGAGSTGSDNVFLGDSAGFNEDVSDKLYIDNTGTSTPLIYGDFANDFLRFYADSVYIPGAIAQFHRIDSIDVSTAGSWVTVEFDSLIANESTYGYRFNADSTGFYTSFAGDTRVQGCGHWLWGGADNTDVKVYLRVLINNVEARCLQANDSREAKTSDDGVLPFVGTINHTANQEIKLQYQVSNIGMDFEGSAVFDNPVAFSINFEKTNND